MKSIIQKLTQKTFLSKVGLLVGFLWLGAATAWAQAEQTAAPVAKAAMSQTEWLVIILFSLTVVTMLLVLVALIYLTAVLRMVLLKQKGATAETEEETLTLWQSFQRSLTQAVPVQREKSILLDHNYDGIRELDNHLPPWWLYLFYVCIAFAFVYLFNYHVFKISPLQADEYVAEVKQAEVEIAEYRKLAGASIDETNVVLTDIQAEIDAGKAIFEKECAACHGKAGEGKQGNGPNLTDEFWLHGGGVKDVFSTIKYGVPEKGMISWEKKLKPDEMRNIATYILVKLQGTKPANGKEPQGEKYVPEEGDKKINLK